MKKVLCYWLFLFCYLASSTTLFSQTLFVTPSGGTFVLQIKRNGSPVTQTAEDIKKIRVAKNLRFDVSLLPVGATFKIESTPAGGTVSDITSRADLVTLQHNQYKFIKKDSTVNILKLTVTPPTGSPVVFTDFGVSALPMPQTGTNVEATNPSWRKYLEANTGGYLDIIKGKQRYFSYKNIAYICLDPFGNIIGKKPVNLDQDDEIVILMVVPDTEDFDNFSVNDNDAEYAPSDLSIRPTEALSNGIIHSGEGDIGYTVKVFNKGPYTSSDVTFTVMIGNKMLNNITVHINALHHLAIGVSYISTNVESPDFQVTPLTPTTNTIQAANTGRRTMLTVNAIWYWWATLRYLTGSDLTRGRDVLKEPNFITRFNPTFGVGLSSKIESNFFAGVNFEFARGGSLTAGWHYGKIPRLLDKNFKLGETEFTGVQADIKTENYWKWGGFFGITLDTRILNRLFAVSKTSNP